MTLAALLHRAGMSTEVSRFQRVGSARRLYHFHVDQDRIHG